MNSFVATIYVFNLINIICSTVENVISVLSMCMYVFCVRVFDYIYVPAYVYDMNALCYCLYRICYIISLLYYICLKRVFLCLCVCTNICAVTYVRIYIDIFVIIYTYKYVCVFFQDILLLSLITVVLPCSLHPVYPA